MAAEYSDMSVESESLTDDFDYLANLLDSADVEMYLEDVEEEVRKFLFIFMRKTGE